MLSYLLNKTIKTATFYLALKTCSESKNYRANYLEHS